MNTLVYVARVLGDQAAGYHATFPDLPGVTADGASMGELLIAAREALGAELKRREDGADSWPEPTPIDRVGQSPGDGILILVDVSVDDTPVRVNISIGERLLGRIDRAAESRGMTRSGFIASAARTALGEKGEGKAGAGTAGVDFEAAQRKLQDELSAMGRKISESLGPDSAFSRSMTELDNKLTDAIRKAADNVSAAMARRREHEAHAAAADAATHGAAQGGATQHEPGPGAAPYAN